MRYESIRLAEAPGQNEGQGFEKLGRAEPVSLVQHGAAPLALTMAVAAGYRFWQVQPFGKLSKNPNWPQTTLLIS